MTVWAHLSADGKRIEVAFEYSTAAVAAIKAVAGAKFVPASKGGPKWTVPLDITAARQLREEFGPMLRLTEPLKRWGRAEVAAERARSQASGAEDAALSRLPAVLPTLHGLTLGSPLPELGLPAEHPLSCPRPNRPYQRVGMAFIAGGSCIVADEPGLGKTAMTIGGVFEAGLDNGPMLVVAPVSSIEPTWRYELETWQPHRVITTSGEDSKKVRAAKFAEAKLRAEAGDPFWFVTNPHMLRNSEYLETFFRAVPWNVKVVDEFHAMGLSNNQTAFSKALRRVASERTVLLSGTPLGGKPINLFGALQALDPERFSSKWRWAEQWLELQDVYTPNGTRQEIGGLKPGSEEQFLQAHARYLLRRRKEDVLQELPKKQRINVWVGMSRKQEKQYREFSERAELAVGDASIPVTTVLAEYTRLRQFAGSYCDVEFDEAKGIRVLPTADSPKLKYLLEILSERGIEPRKGAAKEAVAGSEQVVVFSQFSTVVEAAVKELRKQGFLVGEITGKVGRDDRRDLAKSFQSGTGPDVLVMTTTAGGVSLTLDRASTVVFLDETWNPDDQVQGEDRVHRASRIHQVTVYYLRTKGTIEERIFEVGYGKRLTNKQILDLRHGLVRGR